MEVGVGIWKTLGALSLIAGLTTAAAVADDGVAARFMKLDRTSSWRQVAATPLKFKTGHPQGLVKIGDDFYMSTVELAVRPERYDKPQGGFDRSPGKGVGKILRFGADGTLKGEVTLGEGNAYHPGGLDYDGSWIWVPVAEYRPDSASVVYRVDPVTLKADPVLRFKDHLGAVVHDVDDGRLHAASWGSRRFYSWKMDPADRPGGEAKMRPNTSHYVDFQDCHALPDGWSLCGGLTQYEVPGKGKIGFGGLELVNFRVERGRYQLPVPLWVTPEIPMTHNPFWAERAAKGLRFYFVPEDDVSRLFTYEVGG
jgi:hypothetical protein